MKDPGAAATATRGASNQFRDIPKMRPKGAGGKRMACLRRNAPGRFWRQRHEPFRRNLGDVSSLAGKGKKGSSKSRKWKRGLSVTGRGNGGIPKMNEIPGDGGDVVGDGLPNEPVTGGDSLNATEVGPRAAY